MGALGPIPVSEFRPRGNLSAYNVTAAAVLKATPGTIMRISVISAGTTSGSITVNDANALVTAQTVTAITQATQAVATLSTGGGSNPFAVGNTITFASVVGMTQINGLVGTVTAIGGVTTAWTVTVNINSTAFTAYASGGTASSFGVGNEIFSALFSSATASSIITLEWPCANGILVSAVPTAGSPQYSISYS